MIIKTLVLPQVTHLFSMTYTPLKFLEQIDKLIFKFLWNNKPSRVKRETIIATVDDGGLRMTDIFAFHSAQKIITMKNLIVEDDKCLNLFQSLCGIKKHLLDHKLSDSELEKITNFNFHQQMLKCWFNFKSKSPESLQDMLNEYVFLNRYVTINSNLIHPKELGLNEHYLNLKIIDLLNHRNKFMTCEELGSWPNWSTNILHTNSLLAAIPKRWKLKINSSTFKFQGTPCFGLVLNKCITPITKVTSRKVYWDIVKSKTTKPTSIEIWVDLFPFLESVNWSSIYKLVYKISNEPYLQSFQYKILNRTVNCRYNLQKWNKISSNKCLHCFNTDTLEHHFYYCPVSTKFWGEVNHFLHNTISVKINVSVCEILFGIFNYLNNDSDVFLIINFIILLGKWFLNNCKSSERPVIFSEFVKMLKDKLESIRVCHTLKSDLEAFHSKFGILYL